MAVERRRQPLKVEIPREDAPRLARVGLIAIIGFAIGAIWPTVANVKLVPSAPTPATPGLGGEPVPASSASAAPAAAPAEPAAPPQPETAAPAGPEVGEAKVTSCRNKRGERVESCDQIAFDRVARRRLTELGGCEGSSKLSGVLSLGFEVDFEKNQVSRVFSGKSTTLREAAAETLVTCARKAFADASLEGLEHQQAQYTVFYLVDFKPSSEASAEAEPGANPDVSVTPASGRATVSWEVALVRSAPSRDGKVVARILSGTRVVVTGRNGDWYQIKYDAKGEQGWVFRTAIGM